VRRRLAYLLIWTIGSAATVGACWLGLRSVLDAAVPQRATPLSAAELARAAPSPEVPPTTDPATPVPTAAPAPTITITTTPPGPAATTSAAPAPTTTTTASAAAQLAMPATAATTATAGWEVVATGRGGTAYRRTFHVQGGDITFWCDEYDVHVMAYSLKSGYVIDYTRYSVRSLLVSLLSTQRASRVYVAWRNGPYAEVTETVA
jgi:hypothetical protein